MPKDPFLTVWFDGECPLCTREIAMMQRLDRQNSIIFIDACGSDATECPIDRAMLLDRLHARKGETMYSGAAAFVAMWKEIPALRMLGLVASIPGAMPVLEVGYRFFLRVRPGLQSLVRALSNSP